ncbi:MAG: hypothetical protein Q9162_007333 [Coniocarpon cinnabarinum]
MSTNRVSKLAPLLQQHLQKAKLAELKAIAFHIGLPSSGTKKLLTHDLGQQLLRPRMAGRKKYKVLGIDMGIRNLAYCLMEVSEDDLQKAVATTPAGAHAGLFNFSQMIGLSRGAVRIKAWSRLGLTSATHNDLSLEDHETGQNNTLLSSESWMQSSAKLTSNTSEEAMKTFDPAIMSKVAYHLVDRHILGLHPTHILIEEQRHRSGGSFGILEWTYRVNMLEAMLHAILYALSASGERSKVKGNRFAWPSVSSIAPKRMKNYWLSNNCLETLSKQDPKNWTALMGSIKPQDDKAERVALVRFLLQQQLHLSEDLETLANRAAFLAHPKTRQSVVKGSKSSSEVEERPRQSKLKLDDLADSLLHGLAFVDWEVSRRLFLQKLESFPDTG